MQEQLSRKPGATGGSAENAWSTTPGTKHREVQVSREGRMPVVTGGVRVKHDCMDAGGRATHGAVAEDARTEFSAQVNSKSLFYLSAIRHRMKLTKHCHCEDEQKTNRFSV